MIRTLVLVAVAAVSLTACSKAPPAENTTVVNETDATSVTTDNGLAPADANVADANAAVGEGNAPVAVDPAASTDVTNTAH